MISFNTIVFWSVAGITLAVSLLLAYSIIRFQHRLANQPPTDAGDFRDNNVLSFIWTLVPIGILASLLILAFQTMQL